MIEEIKKLASLIAKRNAVEAEIAVLIGWAN